MSPAGEIDSEKVEEFGEKLIDDLSAMTMGPLAYMGDQLGLFEHLADGGPMSIEELAEASSCEPRYVEEWVSAMAAAGWVEYDPDTGTFDLPPEHAVFLAQPDHPHYMGGALESIGIYGQVAPRIMECFRNGGGVTLEEHHPDFPRVIDRFTAPLYKNFLPDVWIVEMLPELDERLREGAKVADVGCGSGRALAELAQYYGSSQFVGYEPNEASATRARDRVRELGLEDQIEIVEETSERMPDSEYDLVSTFDVIHDLVDPESVIEDIHRALKPSGTYLMMEINASEDLEEMLDPLGAWMYSISTLYCLPYSLANDGAGIGTCMGERLPREMCEKAGFRSFRKLPFEHPFSVLYEVTP